MCCMVCVMYLKPTEMSIWRKWKSVYEIMSYVQLYTEFLYFFCSFLNFRFKEYKNWIPAESVIHFHTCKRSHGIKTNKSNWQMLRKTLSEITFHVKWGDNKCSLMAVSKIISKWYIILNILKFLPSISFAKLI